jgi:hypothetical protein
VDEKLIAADQADKIVRVIESERSVDRITNEITGEGQLEPAECRVTHRLSHKQLVAELAERECKLQKSRSGGETDQWLAYSDIIHDIQHNKFLRAIVQASAGTGFSYTRTQIKTYTEMLI